MPGTDQNPRSPFGGDEEGRKQAELLEKLLRDVPVYKPELFERKWPEDKPSEERSVGA